MNQPLVVLPSRKCGTPKKGGLYSISLMSPNGTLEPFTALVAPQPAEIDNPRSPQVVSIPATLESEIGGLHFPTGQESRLWKSIPSVGLADLWGVGAGYKDTWDAVAETKAKGICRRVAKVSDLRTPIPVLMMHMEAVVTLPETVTWDEVNAWLDERDIEPVQTYDPDAAVFIHDKPYLDEEKLGRVGCDTFLWHPYIKLYMLLSELRARRLRTKFLREFDVSLTQGIFGLSWITAFVYVLGEDEDTVPDELAQKGVLSAITEDDPRREEATE